MNCPRVEIHYCTGCRWLLRSAWLAQELLSTFEHSLGEVALIPAGSGEFLICVRSSADQSDTITVWNRATDGGFPDAKVLKQRVRDVIEPDRDLGHSDVTEPPAR